MMDIYAHIYACIAGAASRQEGGMQEPAGLLHGVPRSKGTASSQDPTVGPSLGPYRAAKGGGVSLL